jgi:hypothetical protein
LALHRYVYAGVPPLAVTVKLPAVSPKHIGADVDIEAVNAGGDVTSNDAVAEQPPSS